MKLTILTTKAQIENHTPLYDKLDNSIIKLYDRYFLKPYQCVDELFENKPYQEIYEQSLS